MLLHQRLAEPLPVWSLLPPERPLSLHPGQQLLQQLLQHDHPLLQLKGQAYVGACSPFAMLVATLRGETRNVWIIRLF
jgi:hypothetical protein